MRAVLRIGTPACKIIYANPCKAATGLAYAREHGVRMTTFDNLDELDNVKKELPEARLVLRIFADDATASVALGAKYGVRADSAHILLIRAKEMGLNVVGVSFHIGMAVCC